MFSPFRNGEAFTFLAPMLALRQGPAYVTGLYLVICDRVFVSASSVTKPPTLSGHFAHAGLSGRLDGWASPTYMRGWLVIIPLAEFSYRPPSLLTRSLGVIAVLGR